MAPPVSNRCSNESRGFTTLRSTVLLQMDRSGNVRNGPPLLLLAATFKLAARQALEGVPRVESVFNVPPGPFCDRRRSPERAEIDAGSRTPERGAHEGPC
jgi:hypothetical protein